MILADACPWDWWTFLPLCRYSMLVDSWMAVPSYPRAVGRSVRYEFRQRLSACGNAIKTRSCC